MERRGVKVDEQQLDYVRKLIDTKISESKAVIPENLNVRSPVQMEKLMRDAGHTNWPLTAKGRPSFPETWLETFELGQKIVAVKKYTNLKNSFIEGQIMNHLHKGRIHTTFNQLKMDDYGTVTGRLSASEPNLQQVPKRNKELAKMFRTIFVPDDGYIWSANDYKQQEFVVFAHYSESAKLIEGYNQDPPVDMHSACSGLMGVERDLAKQLNLGKLYWMGIPKLADKLKISVMDAGQLSRSWDDALPEASIFRYNAKSVAESRITPSQFGYVRSILGRRRRYKDIGYSYQAANAIIQMSSADITKLKMVEIDDLFIESNEEAQLLLQVHDELDWQFPIGGTALNEKALGVMQNFQEGQPIVLRARLGVDHSAGKNWSEATFN
jgi:DNA polymerase-1